MLVSIGLRACLQWIKSEISWQSSNWFKYSPIYYAAHPILQLAALHKHQIVHVTLNPHTN